MVNPMPETQGAAVSGVNLPPAISFSISEAVAATRGTVSRTALYEALQRGELTAKKLRGGKRTFILASELARWLESQPDWKPRAA